MKMDKNLHIPQGYRQTEVGVIPDDWEVVRLSQIGNVIGGGTPDTENGEYWNDDIYWFTPTEIKQKYINKSVRKISKKGLQKSSAKILSKNTLLLTTRATIGDIGIALNECSTNQGFQSIFVNEKNSYMYIYYWILNNRNELIKRSSGSTFLEISKREIEKIQLIRPPKQEQQKIADILTTWDNAINQQTTLIEKKQQLKKGLMQQLLTAKTRFSEFSDDWEIVKLNNIGITYNGLTKKTAIDFQNGSYKYIAYMNIFSNSKINTLISDFVQIQLNENQNKVQYGDIFFTTSSETPEEVGMSSVLLEDIENTYLNSFCFAYRLNNFDTLLPEFAQFYFRSFFVRYEILRLAQGSTRFNISKKEVLKIKILLPSVREQQKIAQVLTLADDEITKLQTELVLLKIQKKGLMQQLLTGKIRIKI
ncbi:Type I restriction-modification system, specificity subunit S [uncultured Gammaproteobacteria bacterium]|jgi:type I restriction enzyme S subunit|nr:Type I restriction-modification system, specificity subunit S [uncultured Gammaproteobacteria bacterium]CAC9956049.1 Type I restriction-modification system, specificity subunit S [uncultured Gammaproteobacteria bacterium]CAC9968055.1 Type I restriction-modification system, specificity subunit S [uncultured Gammaproteobacteria bacterium]